MKTNEAKRKEQERRIAERNLMSGIEQLEKLNEGRYHAKRERRRLARKAGIGIVQSYNPRGLTGRRVIFNPED